MRTAMWRVIALARSLRRLFDSGLQAVPRASRRVVAIAIACAAAMWRVITLPRSLVVRMIKACGEIGRSVLRRAARGPARIVAPRMVMRAAVVSAVLTVAITASVARPGRAS
jgi:hypothetical protein